MADLSPGSRREGERGQLLLIGAFIIAVSFVVLALVVNSAIFTENLATRDEVAGSGDALEFRHEVVRNGGDLMTEINQNNSIATSDQGDKFENSLGHISTQGALQQSAQGRIIEVENSSITIEDGTKIAQDSAKEFGNSSNRPDLQTADWVVVEDVSNTRNFKMNVSRADELSAPLVNPYELIIDNGSASWTMNVSYASPLVIVTVESPSSSNPEICTRNRAPDESIEIDVTGGTVGGEPCHALTRTTDGTRMWFGLENDYQIEFNNWDSINGTYSLIIDDGTFPNPDNFGDGFGNPSNDNHDPYFRDAIYNATVPFNYYTEDVGYETEIEIAPGEVPP